MSGSSMKAPNPSHVRSKEPLSRYGPGRYVLAQCVRLGKNTAFGNAYVPLRRYLGRARANGAYLSSVLFVFYSFRE